MHLIIRILKFLGTIYKSDHPSNSKRRGGCSNYKKLLHLRVLNIQYLHECINIELKIGDKLCYIIALDRSLSQSIYFKTLDSLVQNSPFLVVFTDGFNEKPKNWYKNDNCTFEGNPIENVTSQFSLKQLIKESTHFLDNPSSCIDLIFISRANLLIESGGHRPLHSYCHHQIVYSKFDFQNYLCSSSLFT